MAERKNSPTSRLRDLDNPTAAFPIGALSRGTPPARQAHEEDETERRPMPRIPIHSKFSDEDDEDYDSKAFALPPAPVSVDPRLLVMGLLVATAIAMLGAVIAAVMVMM